MGFLLALLLTLLPAPRAEEVRWYALPNVGVDTDDGLGFGARFELQRLSEGFDPYRSSLVVQAYASLRGYHHHRVRYDRVGLGPAGRVRWTTFVAWRQWSNDGYWGIGARAPRELAYAGTYDRDDPRRKRYRYALIQPFAQSTVRVRLDGPWRLYGSFTPRYSVVRTYADSLLAEQQPFGMDGGLTLQLSAGVLYDTRAPEIGPRQGVLLEASGRWAPPHPLSAGHFGGVFLSARQFLSLGPRAVFAWRLMGEMLWGQVPFYEMVHWGGFEPIQGYGGWQTLRGIKFGRFRAPGKAVGNAELRLDTVTHSLLKKPAVWQLVPYLDVGRVFAAGEQATAPPPQGLGLDSAAGVGVRLVFDEVFVGRVDMGFGRDPVQLADGQLAEEATLGFYLVFDHTF
ncbi:MAG: BamA/TamA family outer membrane protein [Alphaproteobacteria bacterium]|nr:BamA/TamA family outer membrane protein [Alphaproteobacteria bacterium]